MARALTGDESTKGKAKGSLTGGLLGGLGFSVLVHVGLLLSVVQGLA